MFKKVEGHVSAQNPNGEAKVLFRATAINANQMKLVEEIKEHYAATDKPTEEQTKRWEAGIFTRKELRDAHGVLRGKKAAPYFISKNLACKVNDQHGCYCVNRLKMSAEAAKAAEAETAEPMPAAKKKVAAKKPAAKKESGKRRETAKKQIAAPESKELATT